MPKYRSKTTPLRRKDANLKIKTFWLSLKFGIIITVCVISRLRGSEVLRLLPRNDNFFSLTTINSMINRKIYVSPFVSFPHDCKNFAQNFILTHFRQYLGLEIGTCNFKKFFFFAINYSAADN